MNYDFINPFDKTRCPFCDEDIHLGDCRIISRVQQGKILHIPATYARKAGAAKPAPSASPGYSARPPVVGQLPPPSRPPLAPDPTSNVQPPSFLSLPPQLAPDPMANVPPLSPSQAASDSLADVPPPSLPQSASNPFANTPPPSLPQPASNPFASTPPPSSARSASDVSDLHMRSPFDANNLPLQLPQADADLQVNAQPPSLAQAAPDLVASPPAISLPPATFDPTASAQPPAAPLTTPGPMANAQPPAWPLSAPVSASTSALPWQQSAPVPTPTSALPWQQPVSTPFMNTPPPAPQQSASAAGARASASPWPNMSSPFDANLPQPAPVYTRPQGGSMARLLARARLGLQTLWTRSRLKRLESYKRELACYECSECSALLPSNVGRVDEHLTIAILGDLSSGKTHYLTVLIAQLLRELILPRDYGTARVMAADQNSHSQYMQQHYQRLFERRQTELPTRTQTRAEPLIYEFSYINPNRVRKAINLVFYDASGEDIYNEIQFHSFHSRILNAKGIIYLADPGQMPNFVNGLDPRLRPASPALHRSFETLNEAIRAFKDADSALNVEPFPLPTAIVIPKIDLLQYHQALGRRPDYEYLWRTDYARIYNRDMNKINGLTRQLLQELNEWMLVNEEQHFEKCRFFAVSATGSPPENGIYTQGVRPHRCLDPLIWLLQELDVIDRF